MLYVVRHCRSGKDFSDIVCRKDLDWYDTEKYPAPTLQEIITNCGPACSFTVKNHPAADKSMVEEALEAWLKFKKIKKETNNENV